MSDTPLNAMAVFARVVECGSFSAAAQDLGMTPSGVSRHVSRLEATLGASLLQRTTRAFALTELGQSVYAACARMTAAAPAELPAARCLYLGYGNFGERWTLRHQAGGEAVVVRIPPRLTLNNSLAIMTMVEGDAGIGLVPDFSLGSALAEGRVVAVLPDWDILEPYTGTAYAVYTPTRHVPPKVRAFVDHLAATAHDQPA